ncbi:MAG: hypothetical protein WC326_03800 [Candidatus Delongbacteria bacterium]
MISAADLWNAGLLIALYLGMVLLVESWTRRVRPDPELSRKAVHFLGGLGTLFLPWLIHSVWLVLSMALLFAAALYAGQRSGRLQCLAAVRRRGAGSAYFPLAVFLLYLICREERWLYVASILVITVSDAAAALVGGSYGRHSFRVGHEHRKSLEGSVLFLLLTFLAIHLPLLLLTELPRETCVLAALLISLLLTGVEAISTRGTDNLYIPLFTCYSLLKITTKPPGEIAFQLLSLLAMMAVLEIFFRSLKLFSIRDSIVFVIFIYGVWSLGSIQWSVPIFACFALYCGVRMRVPNRRNYQVETTPLLRVILIPLLILLLANASGRYHELFGPFLAATVTAFVCVTWAYVLFNRQGVWNSRPWQALAAGAGAALLAVGATMLPQHQPPLAALALIPLLAGVALAAYNLRLRGRVQELPVQGGGSPVLWLALGAAIVYWGLQRLAPLPVWQPLS